MQYLKVMSWTTENEHRIRGLVHLFMVGSTFNVKPIIIVEEILSELLSQISNRAANWEVHKIT